MTTTVLRGMNPEELANFIEALDGMCDAGGDVPLGGVLEWLAAQGFTKETNNPNARRYAVEIQR